MKVLTQCKRSGIAALLAAVSLGGALTAGAGSPATIEEQLAVQAGGERVKWFEEARFGMFIHFGLYSEPGGEWKGKRVGRNWYAEWLRMQAGWPDSLGMPREEYDTLLARFNPDKFNAEEWILAAKEAGMKYFLITAKHHDGFALWPTKVSAYNVVDATPFKRDILGELAAACKQHGITLGFYYSHWQDWGHTGGAMPPWPADRGPFKGQGPTAPQPTQEEFDQYWHNVALPQVRELIRNYDAKFFWFDNWRDTPYLNDERLNQLITLVREESDDTLINSRIGTTWNHSAQNSVIDYISMGDNQFPKEALGKPWETSGTMQRSWGWHKLDYGWKTTDQLLEHLIHNASLGGNYQLNVGPKGDGTFPLQATKRLQEIGAWMAVNGEAIYGTERVSFPENDWGRMTGKQTKDGYRLYLHVFNPEKKMSLPIAGLRQKPGKAYMLETGEPLKSRVKGNGVTVDFSHLLSDERVSVVVLEFVEQPELTTATVSASKDQGH